MQHPELKQRVEARDRLVHEAEGASRQLHEELLASLARGEVDAAEQAAQAHESRLRELTENLRIYQAELHAQADELAASHRRTADLLEQFTALFSHMPVAVLLVAANGEVLEHNGMAERLLQMRPASISARFMHRLVDGDHFQAVVRPAFLQASATGSSQVDNLVFIGEQGARFVGELHIARLPGRGRQDSIYACAVVDRTEHLRDVRALEGAAESLRQSRLFLADAARVARTGGWEITLRPRAMRCSDETRELLDLAIDQPVTLETLLGLCERHDRAALANAIAGAEGGTPFEVEIDMHSTLGRSLRVLAVGQAERDGTAVTRVHGVLQDITKQHLVRRLLGDLSERLSIANDAGGIGVWDCDLVHGSLLFDHRLCQILRLTVSPSVGTLEHALAPVLRTEGLLSLHNALDAAVRRLEPLNLELQLRTDVGERERWLHLSGRAQPDASGHAVRLVGCAWDSSPQHEAMHLVAAKEAAEAASRAKSAFLSRMSHELRTPLNAILGFSQLMRLQAEAGDLVLQPKRVVLIENAARHLLELVNEVLDVSRIESGHMDVNLVEVDLAAVVDEALPMVRGQAEQRGVTLHLPEHGSAPVRALADRLRVKEVLINLLSNSVKYNLPGGHVVVTISAGAGQVVVSVADTGAGLNERQLAGLFQPFNRVGAERTGIEGSGMGLFVSRRFVELMGGRIEVQSRAGAGTTFSVVLQAPPGGG
jgi:two-component system, cell cycle sensor histidine kinase PleC